MLQALSVASMTATVTRRIRRSLFNTISIYLLRLCFPPATALAANGRTIIKERQGNGESALKRLSDVDSGEKENDVLIQSLDIPRCVIPALIERPSDLHKRDALPRSIGGYRRSKSLKHVHTNAHECQLCDEKQQHGQFGRV
ncbi:hypothetical protein [Alcanivorax xiamenensis]|uniref:hypothetical protein n=1 Tax=Alcanivorax xiamenensis TaxID=1177156 RepID=UPI00135CD5D1|nr:hypothetical protein [Alcanivorax xiamenensis]